MKINITRLRLINFKGQKDLEIRFNPDVTNITADNGKGKSTILAAFCWLFTGKDQFDSADLNKIKTYDSNGRHIEKIEHSVEADILVDNTEMTVKRVLIQNWVKRRGETETVLDGHKTEYYINGVGCGTEKAFKEEISKLFDEQRFKLLTNPLYFNALPWKDKRNILLSMAPAITDSEVLRSISTADNSSRIDTLVSILYSGVSLEKKKAELAAKKKQKNEQLALIPARIDATRRMKPDAPEEGFETIEAKVKELENSLSDITNKLIDKNKANEDRLSAVREKQNAIHKIKLAIQTARNEASLKRKKERDIIVEKLNDITRSVSSKKRDIASIQDDIKRIEKERGSLIIKKETEEKQLPILQQRKQELANEFFKVDALSFEFNLDECICPTCKTPLSGDNLEAKKAELEACFNKDKSKKLDEIEQQGASIKNDILYRENKIKDINKRIDKLTEEVLGLVAAEAEAETSIAKIEAQKIELEKQLAAFDEMVVGDPEEVKDLTMQLSEAESKEVEEVSDLEKDNLLEQRAAIQKSIDDLKKVLSNKSQIEKADKQISEYENEEKRLSQEVAEIESIEDIIFLFTKTKIESIESRVNSMFNLVTFRMFDTRLNGEEKECCDALEPNGTPVNDTNSAMEVNCGLDIINQLSKHFGLSLPIFIDNRETVSEIIPVEAQIINLEKVKGQSTLKVE